MHAPNIYYNIAFNKLSIELSSNLHAYAQKEGDPQDRPVTGCVARKRYTVSEVVRTRKQAGLIQIDINAAHLDISLHVSSKTSIPFMETSSSSM